MKAEQRKELETNTLADKMGNVVQRVKTSQRRTVLVYFITSAALVLALVLSYRWYRTSQEESSELWWKLDDGSGLSIMTLAEKEPGTAAGKAARFQLAWFEYWEVGVKRLAVDSRGALISLDNAAERYRKLAEDCKDDPIFEPQALLGIAVCEEAKAIQVRTRLDKAATLYDEILKKNDGRYKDTAEGRFAQARLDQLRDKNGKIRAEVSSVYEDLQKMLRVPDVQAPRPQFNFDHDFGKDKKKDE